MDDDFACIGRHRVSGLMGPDLPDSPYTLTPGQPTPGSPTSCVPLCLHSSWSVRVHPKWGSPLATMGPHGRGHGGTGISTGCASTTPLRPRLSSRLTLGRISLPQEPWAFGRVSPPSLLMPTFSLDQLPRRSHRRFLLQDRRSATLSYQDESRIRPGLTPLHIPARSTRPSGAVTHSLKGGCF